MLKETCGQLCVLGLVPLRNTSVPTGMLREDNKTGTIRLKETCGQLCVLGLETGTISVHLLERE
jgi:hypothetical protein